MSHPVTHFEVLGPDGKKLQQFYASLFGWKVDANNPMDYGMVEKEGNGIGGGISNSMDGQSRVTFYVEASDPQAVLDQAQKLGGKLVMPLMDVPGGPTIGQFADPAGNVIGVAKAM